MAAKIEASPELLSKMMGISVDQIADYKKVFKQFDEDGSGSISKNEFKEILGILKLESIQEMTEDIFKLVDRDGVPGLSFNEFIYAMAHYVQNTQEIPLVHEMKQFKRHDKDGNNALSKDEVRQMLTKFEYPADTLEQRCQSMFRADLDGDGQISLKEYLNYFSFS